MSLGVTRYVLYVGGGDKDVGMFCSVFLTGETVPEDSPTVTSKSPVRLVPT